MKRKILFGILTIFMSISFVFGITFFAGDNALPTSSVVEEDEGVEAKASGNWWDNTSNGISKVTVKNGVISAYIQSNKELAWFAHLVNQNYYSTDNNGNKVSWSTAYVYLETDIDLSAHYWTPIGTYDIKYTGWFNGNGHKITGLTISKDYYSRSYREDKFWVLGVECTGNTYEERAYGLFGVTNGATIQDLTINNATMNITPTARASSKVLGIGYTNYLHEYYGSVVGKGINTAILNLDVNNLDINASIYGSASLEDLDLRIGGVAGLCADVANVNVLSGAIDVDYMNSIDNGDNLYHVVGGVVGQLTDSLMSSYSYVTINMRNNWQGPLQEECWFAGDDMYIGGVVGYADGSNPSAEGNVEGANFHGVLNIGPVAECDDVWAWSTHMYIGGVVGGLLNDTNAYYCYNYGNLTTNAWSFTGGIVGYTSSNSNVYYSANLGKITLEFSYSEWRGRWGFESADEFTGNYGGIVGYNCGMVWYCANYGDVTGHTDLSKAGESQRHSRGFGGIAGYNNEGNVSHNINYGTIKSGYLPVGGIVGEQTSLATVSKCVNIGDVQGYSGRYSPIYGNVDDGAVGTYIENFYSNTNFSKKDISNSKYESIGDLHNIDYKFDNANWWTKTFGCMAVSESFSYDSRDNKAFFFSPLIAHYFDKEKGFTIQYNGSGTSYYLDYLVTPIFLVGKAYCYNSGYSKSFAKMVVSNTVGVNYEVKFVGTDELLFLRGIDYSTDSNYFNHFYIDTSSMEPFFTFEGIEISGAAFDGQVISYKTNSNYRYLKFNWRPIYTYHWAEGSSFYTTSFDVKAKENEVTLAVKYIDVANKNNNDTFKQVDTTDCVIVDGYSSKVKYYDEITFNITQQQGYKFLGIANNNSTKEYYINDTKEFKFDIFNPDADEANILAENIEVSSLTNMNSYYKTITVYVYYEARTFGGEIIYKTESKTNSKTNSTENARTDFSIVGPGDVVVVNQSIQDSPTDWYFAYGYGYKFYIDSDANEELTSLQLRVKYEEFKEDIKDNKVKLEKNDVFGLALSGKFSDVIETNFNIIVVRTPIEYKIELYNLSNVYYLTDRYFEFSDGYGGESDLVDAESNAWNDTNVTFNIDDTLTFTNTPKAGFSLEGLYYTLTKDDGKEYFSTNNDNKIELSDSKNFKDLLGMLYNKGELVQDLNSSNELTIKLYSCFELKNYAINIYVENDLKGYLGLDSDQSNSNNSRLGLTAFSGSSWKVSGVRYYSPITLTAKDFQNAGGPSGKIFAGWYLGDKLLSNEKTYKFEVDPVTMEISELSITAMYLDYETSDEEPEDSITKTVNGNTSILYKIESAQDLVWLSNQVLNGNTFKNDIVQLQNDIDFDGVNWLPIGHKGLNKQFKGTFDGNGYIIKNLNLEDATKIDVYNTPEDEDDDVVVNLNKNLTGMGLFGYTNGATIKNLTLLGGKVYGYANVGAIAAYAENTTFENVNNFSCQVFAQNVDFVNVYGVATTEIYTNYDSASYNSRRNRYVPTSFTTSNFDAQKHFGGIVGYAKSCQFNKVSNRANVSYSANTDVDYVAGLVGGLENETKFDLSFHECINQIEGVDHSNLFANELGSEATYSNCYYRYKDDDDYITYYYNASTADGGTYSGDELPTSTSLNTSIWLKIYDRWMIKELYWN